MIFFAKRPSDLDIEKLSHIYCTDGDFQPDSFCEDVYDYFSLGVGGYAVMQVGEDYASAVRFEPYADGFLISCLQTAGDFRRQGYAENLIRRMREELSKPLYSHVDKRNHASMQLHNKCGFRLLSDTARLLDGTVTSRFVTLFLE